MSQVDEAQNIGDANPDRETAQGFTPGPWKVEVGGDKRDVIITDPTGNTVCEPNTWEQDFSDMDPTVRNIPLNEAMANARLIAAAPALFEAARFALSVLSANPIEMSERMAIEKLDAALALIDKSDDESAKAQIQERNPLTSEEAFQCDSCDSIVPRSQLQSGMPAAGVEGSFCAECRGEGEAT